ncbi:hypothetical protein BG003_011507 [Podila horticola]|nr:hypothetical protein BG003_011507 [Podila horticola]
MNADGAFANTFLKKVREEKSEIHNILVAYSTKHHFDVYKLPSHLVWFRPEEDMITATKSLQHRYHICLIQEFEILIATNDRAALPEYLTKIQCTIREIEKYIFHYRKTGYFLPIPPCLLSCYVKASNTSFDRLQCLYEILTDQQFKIALQDAKNAHPGHVQNLIESIICWPRTRL